MREYKTQMEAAKKGIITPEMKIVAEKEYMDPEKLRVSEKLSHNFEHYLPLFLDGGYSELFFDWDGESWDGIPQYFSYDK